MYYDEKFEKLGFKTITPIQEEVFSAFNNNRNMVLVAPTGTGKTHAYLVPIYSKIDISLEMVQAIIIVPTNELVIQVSKMAREIDEEVKLKSYYGSIDKKREISWLQNNQPQIVVGTPSKINEFLRQGLNVSKVSFLVFDEADMMFDQSFMEMIDDILPSITKARLFLASASITKAMQPFITKYFGNVQIIDTTKKHRLKIEYYLINIKGRDRLQSFSEALKVINPFLCFVFVTKKEEQAKVYQEMLDNGYNVCNLNSSLNVKQRKSIISDINNYRYQYVVTSDLGARGLDFKVSHVINYDLPNNLEYFTHRSGRTGRMNDTGIVISFMSVDDHRKIEALRNKGVDFQNVKIVDNGFVRQNTKGKKQDDEVINAIKTIRKPTTVKPNYKKKNKEQIRKKIKEVKGKRK